VDQGIFRDGDWYLGVAETMEACQENVFLIENCYTGNT